MFVVLKYWWTHLVFGLLLCFVSAAGLQGRVTGDGAYRGGLQETQGNKQSKWRWNKKNEVYSSVKFSLKNPTEYNLYQLLDGPIKEFQRERNRRGLSGFSKRHSQVICRPSHIHSQRHSRSCRTDQWRASSSSRNQASQRSPASSRSAGRWPSLLYQENILLIYTSGWTRMKSNNTATKETAHVYWPGKLSQSTSMGVARLVSPIFWYLSFKVSAYKGERENTCNTWTFEQRRSCRQIEYV